MIAQSTTLSGGALVAVVVLVIAQVALLVVGLVDLVRRPAVLGGHKWVWLIVMLLFSVIGPIIYLAVGRVPAPVAQQPEPTGGTKDRASAAADRLYGAKPGGNETAGASSRGEVA